MVVGVGILLIFVNIHSFIHTIFCVLWGSVSVGRCAFFVFGLTNMQLVNCLWKIRVALKRVGFGATCVG